MGSRSNDLCPYKKRRGHSDTNREEGQAKMEAEIEMTQLQARNAEGPQEAPEAGRGKEEPLPTPTTPNLQRPC